MWIVFPQLRAEERFLSWHSDIVVEKSGDLLVTETIAVQAEGDRIKRGIYRDLPVLREGEGGLRTTKRFAVLSVKRDGKRENYKRERIENGLRIRIGNKDKYLRKGEIYTYEITYRTGRQLYLEEGREALYWNVNGTESPFPADRVSATVQLPEGIKGTKVWGYTGKGGDRGEDYVAELTETGASIEATRPFQARENLTVMLEWPPGLLDRRAYEDERVLSFDSLIKVENNGDLLITERIEARFEGKFTRPFSRQEDVRWGLKRKRPLEVLKVKLNGKETNSNTSWAFPTVRTGQVVKWGVHTVEITYRTGRQLLLLKDRELLRWNLNPQLGWKRQGLGGSFPVDKVSATVELPGGIQATLGQIPAEMQAEITPTGAKFETRVPTQTLELQWPPGLLAPIAYEEDSFPEAHPWVVFSLVLFAGSLIYYLLAWVAVGRDPKKGVILPQFAPPAGYSPGAVRYLDRMGYDETCMAAGLLGLAAKGEVAIKKSIGTYTVRRRSKPPPLPSGGPPPLPSALAPEERALRDTLVGDGKIALESENWKTIRQARRNHESLISRKLRKTHFLRNMGWCFPGLFLTLVGMLVLFLAIGAFGRIFFIGVACCAGCGWSPFALWKAFTSWGSGRKGTAIALLAVCLPVCVLGALLLVVLLRGSGLWAVMGFLYPALLNMIFFYLIKAPTPLGRKVLDHVEGFRHYLSVAEEERLNLENPPEKTPELFEQFLPYALALGCEQQWAQKFDSILRAAGQSPGSSGWTSSYYTDSVSGLGSSFASSIGSSLSSSLAASSSSPTFSGGGGSSGGGGGGGGVDGW